MQPCLLSIVIANYNYGRFLEDAIRSVINQDGFDRCELIVVDGGSTDNSVDVIRKYADKLAWWCSERDRGQSDAFNKGFAHAKGRFLTWLNADDILLPGTLSSLAVNARRHPACEWFTGNYLQFRQDNGMIRFAPWGPHIVPGFAQALSAPLVIFGPSTFWSRAAYAQVGPLNVDLHYSMDTEYWLRMKKAGFRQRRLNHCCWAFRMHDASKTADYEGREIADKTKEAWYEELRNVQKALGCHVSAWRVWLMRTVRLFDGSALVSLYRHHFVRGRKLLLVIKEKE